MKTMFLNTLLAIGLVATGVYFTAETTVTPEQDKATVCEQSVAMLASGGNAKNGKGGKACDEYGAESPRSGSGSQGAGMRQGKMWRVYL